MKKTVYRLATILSLVVAVLLMTACQPGADGSNNQPNAGLANPASVYCVELGYQLDIRQSEGGEEGVCVFGDGEECPEWDFLAGRCGQAYSFCQQNSGTLVENDTNIGVCVFEDQSTCDELAFSQGECTRGQNPAENE